MIAYFWFRSTRRDLEEPLLRHYHRQLNSNGVEYPWGSLWHDYRLSVIRKVLQAVWEWDIGADEWRWYSHLMRIARAHGSALWRDLGITERPISGFPRIGLKAVT